jgi:hypothetical protein
MTSTKFPRLKPATNRSRTSALTLPNVASGLAAIPSVNALSIWRWNLRGAAEAEDHAGEDSEGGEALQRRDGAGADQCDGGQ